MNPSILMPIFCLFLLPSKPLAGIADIPPVDYLCMSLSNQNITSGYCHAIFSSSSGSNKADFNGLGVIASEKTTSNATNIKATIQAGLSSNKLSDSDNKTLNVCLQVYTEVISNLEGITDAIRDKMYGEAQKVILSTFSSTMMCQYENIQDAHINQELKVESSEFAKIIQFEDAVANFLIVHGN